MEPVEVTSAENARILTGLMREVVKNANALASSIGADAARLDRLADFLNAAGPSVDVREFLAAELGASGRVIREVG